MVHQGGDVANLFLAGRLISATHLAFSSTRVMRTGAAVGANTKRGRHLVLVEDQFGGTNQGRSPQWIVVVVKVTFALACGQVDVSRRGTTGFGQA